MPLAAKSPTRLHVLQNLSLITVSILAIPLSTIVLFSSLVIDSCRHISLEKSSTPREPRDKREPQAQAQPPSPACLAPAPKTILVTGVGMSKGLFIARAFHAAGHVVIGADFEPHSLPVCGRFSKALKRFYRLPSPAEEGRGEKVYTQKLLEIINTEQVDLWISCSGVMSAVADGEAAEAVERHTACVAIQFGSQLTRTLHEKHSFIENTRLLGLNVPETFLVTSVEDAMQVLESMARLGTQKAQRRYVLKSVGVEDAVRADMTLLPLASRAATRAHLARARPCPARPFVLQLFVQGPEYCTHAIVVRGRVVGFTACRSAELLMHYEPLLPDDSIFRALLDYTETYVERMALGLGQEHEYMTGHFSIDFLLDENEQAGKELQLRLFPIECNPRAHTAVVNFGKDGQDMVNAYLSALSHSHSPIANDAVFVSSSTTRHYWIGHDLITRLLLPIFSGKGDWAACGLLERSYVRDVGSAAGVVDV
ncbi:hypothetical protein LOCC1_G006466 [Lachnellula occidentalis]|uniref:ATP-grasp domain-containing protein n=1 Tax=Lachnellula occidentalis TaxID=215460 RepID=A0A8H8RK58_9HELO|nr:hypothetical protein LOCC1_G006466 [Lachnellula occidentalis]